MSTPLSDLRPLLADAQAGGYAVGAFNYCNAETLTAVLEEAEELRSPVILITAQPEMGVLCPELVVEFARSAAARGSVPVCVHLDHTSDLDWIKRCVDARFGSVMFDGSSMDFETNVRLTKEIVDYAHPRGVAVEGEIGAIGRVDDVTTEGTEESCLADPAQAAEFVERTGVDALAVAIGNAHGMYEQLPQLDFARLEAIRKVTDARLVLHGGSGTPLDQLQKAVSLGITKVNVASEMAKAYHGALQRTLDENGWKVWYAQAFAEAKRDVRAVVGRWMRNLGSAGKA